MAMPDTHFDHQFASLGGVRLITRTGTRTQRERSVRHTLEVLERLAHDLSHQQHKDAEDATQLWHS